MQDNDSTPVDEAAGQSKPDDRVTWTVRETAERLGITASSAYTYVESGVLPAVRLGRRLLIPRVAVLALVDKALGEWDGPDVR